MKSLAILLTAASLACAADFVTGQAARLVIGQPTFTRQSPGPASEVILGGVGGVAFAGDTLFVADANRIAAGPINNRVLVFRNVSAQLPGLTTEIQPNAGVRCPVCTGTANAVLGQPDFVKTEWTITQTGLRLPTAVASDGSRLVVADTDNNRVLIWNSIPASAGQPADVVLGQADFKTALPNEGKGNTPSARGLRGPQGVWIQDGRLYVADTHNHRVLVWNSIPTGNFAPANVVLGQSDFNAFVQPDLTKPQGDPKATSMLNPVAVSSDGRRLYVTDLGYNRVLVWNAIPTRNQQPADLVIGQPDLTSSVANNSTKVCPSNGTDSDGKPTYPPLCGATLNFPRFTLSDGKRLFIADGGNDRVLVFNNIPGDNAATADVVLGQSSLVGNWISDNANPLRSVAADAMRTPTSLAWDGTNLYVADPFNRRVLVFAAAENLVPLNGIRNGASREVYAVGTVAFAGTVKENDSVSIKIGEKEYKYKFAKDDTFEKVIRNLVTQINTTDGGDPLVIALPNVSAQAILFTARVGGEFGNDIPITATAIGVDDKTAANFTTGTANTSGGGDAAQVAPGTIVVIRGENLAPGTASAPDVQIGQSLPYELANTQVYFDGIRAPLLFVSPTEVRAQIPWEVQDTNSITSYIRTVRDGRVTVTTPRAVTIIPQNPGIFADEGDDPRPATAYHAGNGYAQGIISVDGSAKANDTGTITIEDRSYTYTVTQADVDIGKDDNIKSLRAIRDGLISVINANAEERVVALPSYFYSRIILRAKQPGDAGTGIPYSASVGTGAQLLLTPTTTGLCCAAAGKVTQDNPAEPGEIIVVYATGLGLVTPDDANKSVVTGRPYNGPVSNDPTALTSALAGGKTANVIHAGLKPGTVGVYEVWLQLNSDIPTNPLTQVTIAQDIYVSNIVTLPVVNRAAPTTP